MRSRAWTAAVLSLGLGLAACGSSGDEPSRPRPPATDRPPAAREAAPERQRSSAPDRRGAPTQAENAVIRGWADALRAGDVAEAARFFAVPAVVTNLGPLLRLPSRAAVEAFNRGLPCGARLLRTQRGNRSLVIATFRLTERPGPGSCGSGTGALARTAFVIRRGRIVQWLRVPDPPAASEPGDAA